MNHRDEFSAEDVIRTLTPFQRNTVEHVMDRFFGTDHADRFLVADETGLGKTIVARGVIARTIEHLQHDDAVDRIDIVYVCSNTDLAQQNLRKLNVTGEAHHGIASRLTLLAKHARHFTPEGGGQFTKPVNLVSFTPGTSFESGWRTGLAEERAMLYLLLERRLRLSTHPERDRTVLEVLRQGVGSADRFRDEYVRPLQRDLAGRIDPTITAAFLTAIELPGANGGASLLERFKRLIDRRRKASGAETTGRLIGELRATLARESIRVLTPDLVILDEFQRFRDLLRPDSEAGELAHHLFNFHEGGSAHGAKVLLLSATPFKPFTYAEEARVGEDHHSDFLKVVDFLSKEDPAVRHGVASALAGYREALLTGHPDDSLTERVQRQLLRVMARTERPRALNEAMASETITPATDLRDDDVLGFVAMSRVARAVQAPFQVEYWKSAPYFVNFMDGYKLAQRVRDALADDVTRAGLAPLLASTQRLDWDALERYEPLDMGNARLRRLAEETVGQGWWKLLWVPPSLPYLVPDGPYADPNTAGLTKRLIFSSWTATPTAVAALLSYEADRLTSGDAFTNRTSDERETERRSRRTRLAHRIDQTRDRPATMATLALFWPMPGLAALADPLEARRRADGPADPEQIVSDLADRLLADGSEPPADERPAVASHWFEAFRRPDSIPTGLRPADAALALAGATEDEIAAATTGDEGVPAPNILSRHIEEAYLAHGRAQDRFVTRDVAEQVAEVAAHSPANIAYRALARVSDGQDGVTPVGLWTAAAQLGSGLRSLFARPETTLLLDQLYPDLVYWQVVLRYCAAGNLQAVLDEYVHHLAVNLGATELDDDGLLHLARAASEAMTVRPARYEAFDPDSPDTRRAIMARFALRYGGRRTSDDGVRLPQVRQAFNSPFWPFVLATTSVGQEGIDFHWWCHAILHWNTPASPVDFEQREGRIDRYDGHAVRKNIARQHEGAIFRSDARNPWQAAYEIAVTNLPAEADWVGDFAPHWVYPGQARIERHVTPFPLSQDVTRLADIKRDVALYRLTFGQPRQEDMIEILKLRFGEANRATLESMRLDLAAPPRPADSANLSREGGPRAGPHQA
ncbi:hypothetical protein PCC79_16440 [Propioniciclava soli]|uniref:Helicase ATP-binding domain-containing protein n=1 Tax=Propioniciclava soli TaxID=2775081 RepID=A0ABZ3C8A9_9ACTN